MRSVSLCLLAAACFVGSPQALKVRYDLPAFRARLSPPEDHELPMGDGVSLHTRVWRPAGEGRWPVVLTRGPYPIDGLLDARCRLLVRYGYACVWQQVRGQGRSGGLWQPFVHELEDGLATLAWLRDQPWHGGRVAMIGESYMAAPQWLLAEELPEEVRTLVPAAFGTDLYAQAYEGGLFRHGIATAWMTVLPERGLRVFRGGAFQRAVQHRPTGTLDVVATGQAVPWFRSWIDQPERDAPFWSLDRVVRMREAPAQTTVPVLMIAGWGDVFLGHELESWQALASREQSSLVIGPWDHLGRVAVRGLPSRHVGDALGLDRRMFQTPRVLAWLDHHLQDRPAEGLVGTTLSYVTGADRWRQGPAWPPPTEPVSWWLAPGGDPQRCEGALDREPSASEQWVGWTYDPADPTPSSGGAGSLASVLPFFGDAPAGVRPQRGLCRRRDDLIGFATPALVAPLALAGAVEVVLSVRSDVEDTALNVRLVERLASGVELHLTEANLALSAREGSDRRVDYRPGEVVSVRLRTWPVDHTLSVGSRLVLQVASASWPKVEAHPNVAGPWAQRAETAVAHTEVRLAGGRVIVPVVR